MHAAQRMGKAGNGGFLGVQQVRDIPGSSGDEVNVN